jgi:hypothetical protein
MAPPYFQNETPKAERKILGLRPKIFWIAVAIQIVIIVAAVGGGVGGALSARNK